MADPLPAPPAVHSVLDAGATALADALDGVAALEQDAVLGRQPAVDAVLGPARRTGGSDG